MAIEQLAEEVVNEVASNLEEAAEVTRKINAAGLGYLAVGLGVGAAVGFYFGYKFNREKIRAEAYEEAGAEVAVLREVYLEKTLNATNTTVDSEGNLQGSVSTEKPPIDKVVEDLGYRVQVPIPDRTRALRPPVPITDVRDLPADILDDLPEDPTETSKSMNAGWNYEEELRDRTPNAPYVIHQNEFMHSNMNYTKSTCTYYADDDFLVDDEAEHPLVDGDLIVGVDNLKFGHGSDDADVVYVRNDRLEKDMQITRLHRSYEEDVLGLRAGSMEDDDDDDDSDDS